jgi:polyhydroxyalkanoate synthesis regulator phasin
MAQTKITIEKLAEMINEGFKSTASKEDIKEVKQDMTALRSEMRAGFERIEHLLLEEQRRKIENLETRMKKLEDALAL